jgi:hypothetical protein
MPVSADAISVKFAHLEELQQAITTARNNLLDNRETWMSFTNNTMSVGWADAAGEQNLFRNADFSDYGTKNEEFLDALNQAVESAKEELRGAVQRSLSYMT